MTTRFFHYRRLSLALCALVLGLWLTPRTADAAVLYTNPVAVSVAPGQTVSITVQFSSDGEAINVLEATLVYPTEFLDAVTVSRAGSFLSLWAEEPAIDADAGRVSFVGGIPNGSVVHNASALEVVFRAKRTGRAVLRFDPFHSSVYLNDGAGSQTALTTDGTTITVAYGDPFLPVITSPTHPDEWAWSSNRTATLRWDAYPGSFYSYRLRRDPNEEPDEINDTPVGEVIFPELTDGVWHFALRQRLPLEGWSRTVWRRLLIDGTPPETFQPDVVRDATGRTLVSFVARDATSGVDHYEMRILRSRFSWFPFFFRGQWTRAVSPIDLTDQATYQSISIRAVDAAGNAQTAVVTNPGLLTAQRRFVLAASVFLLIVLLGIALLVHARHLATQNPTSTRR
ncbi:MAG: hypothetical protein HY340_01300 [Candidatus Kerfeldbacteria bacterium]|nr:hypothetical protein [Candidatus Kerfeldbacteria bacterium]